MLFELSSAEEVIGSVPVSCSIVLIVKNCTGVPISNMTKVPSMFCRSTSTYIPIYCVRPLCFDALTEDHNSNQELSWFIEFFNRQTTIPSEVLVSYDVSALSLIFQQV